MLKYAALLDTRADVITGQFNRDLSLNRLVEIDLLEVKVLKVTTDRMMLLLLDDDRNRIRSFNLEIEQRMAFTQNDPGVTTLDLECGRFLAIRVDDAGNFAVTTQATGDSGTEFGAGSGGKRCAF